ncbi:MAG: P63C domain-containing protein [Pseudohongiellaceae bacterium]|nr:P63C domain-containing protein [Pseudohongiellaceae bacterium]
MQKSSVAVRQGKLELGGWLLDCHHLENGNRVITQRSFVDVIGMKRGGKDLGYRLATLLNNPAMKSNNIKELSLVITNPIKFKMLNGPQAFGYEGQVLVEYCKAILEARRVGAIVGSAALRYARECEAFVIACAKVGIMALIDEATGYAEVKQKDEYRRLFQDFIRSEIREWEKEFPDQFFELIYRLYDLRPTGVNHPQFFGRFIRHYVYDPLASSNGAILEQLDEKNPVAYLSGGRKFKMHQFLTNEIGVPALRQHLWQVIGIGNSVSNRQAFDASFRRAFPQSGDQQEFDLGY